MKRFFMACICAVAALAACDPENGVTTVSANVTIDESGLEENVSAESYEVVFTNTANGNVTTASSENGIATAKVVPGVYTILVRGKVSGDFSYIITGAQKNVTIITDGTEVTIKVKAAKESQLIIKETYYTGSTFKTGEVDENGVESESTYFRDQFHEIYNNSNEVAYADGLCIAYTVFADYTYTKFYTYEGYSADEYVFVQHIWQVPGDGTEYPIQPGESIIIAQWATNHKADALTKGYSPVDLSGAEFEAIEGPKELWNATITDGPAVDLVFAVDAKGFGLQQWMVPTGGANLIIFKPSSPLRTSGFIQAKEEPTANSQAIEIKIADVLDAVQSIDDETRIQTLGMPASLDAGYIWCDGTYVGQSISRVQAGKLNNGRPKYLDTNDTCTDFEKQVLPMIRRNGAGVPAWNTWNN